jgi:hypothetical protein
MKRIAWISAMVGLAAVATGGSACTVTVGNLDDGGLGSGGDSSTGEDTSTEPDTATPDTATPPDAGGETETGSGDDGATSADALDIGTCATLIDTMSPTCNTCVESMCCGEWVACTALDDAGADDAGASACVNLTQCVLDWIAGDDAGTVASGEQVCDPSHTPSEQALSHAFLGCLQGPCAASCM